MWIILTVLAVVFFAPSSAYIEACALINDYSISFNIGVGICSLLCGVWLAWCFLSGGKSGALSSRKEAQKAIFFPKGILSRGKNVGILAAEVYTPTTYVRQRDLEKEYGVPEGKYTNGLGQLGMAFAGDNEDVNSMALTVVKRLLEKFSIPLHRIGRLEVGTESLVDKSKSTKTILMDLFRGSGNHDIEGATVVNACYGGTAALFNALSWVDSSAWDGRYAIVVAADIATYAPGPARPTGGAGAVAFLIGEDAPLAINLHTRSTYACNVWDFYKPDPTTEYPVVDGHHSQNCYLKALDACYSKFLQKTSRFIFSQAGKDSGETSNKNDPSAAGAAKPAPAAPGCVGMFDYYVFHAPYNKLVQKSFARVLYHHARAGTLPLPPPSSTHKAGDYLSALKPWLATPLGETYTDRGLENALRGHPLFDYAYDTRVDPSCWASQMIGNTYTASVFVNICALVDQRGAELANKKVSVFSYGSGALASSYELVGRDPVQTATASDGVGPNPFTLANIQTQLNLRHRLEQGREAMAPSDLHAALLLREARHREGGDFIPLTPLDRLQPGAYYLAGVGRKMVEGSSDVEKAPTPFERTYLRKPIGNDKDKAAAAARKCSGAFLPPFKMLDAALAKVVSANTTDATTKRPPSSPQAFARARANGVHTPSTPLRSGSPPMVGGVLTEIESDSISSANTSSASLNHLGSTTTNSSIKTQHNMGGPPSAPSGPAGPMGFPPASACSPVAPKRMASATPTIGESAGSNDSATSTSSSTGSNATTNGPDGSANLSRGVSTGTATSATSAGTAADNAKEEGGVGCATATPTVPIPIPVGISGISAGLPGHSLPVFDTDNIQRLLRGENRITPLPAALKGLMLEKNVVQMRKNKADGSIQKVPVQYDHDTIQLAARPGEMDLTKYGVSASIGGTMDKAAQMAVAAGLEALMDAGLIVGNRAGVEGAGGTGGAPLSSSGSGSATPASPWELPEDLRDSTGVIYASSFPAADAIIAEVMRYAKAHSTVKAPTYEVDRALRYRLCRAYGTTSENLPAHVEAALQVVSETMAGQVGQVGRYQDKALGASANAAGLAASGAGNGSTSSSGKPSPEMAGGKMVPSSIRAPLAVSSAGKDKDGYEFDRKFLFRILVLGNAQLAQICKARGPNTQTNAACAGTTQAIAMASDMIQLGRADRMVVISGDTASGDTLMPWIGNGFRALGAATIAGEVGKAALPFDRRRSGMMLGSGAVGLVLESMAAGDRRFFARPVPPAVPSPSSPLGVGGGGGDGDRFKCMLLGTWFTNSAYHGASMDRHHIAAEFNRFFDRMDRQYGVKRDDIASYGVYFSHETCTHASPAASCSGNEVWALKKALGEANGRKMVLVNTKAYTGHPMGVSFEDVVAVACLERGVAPAIPHYREPDENLGPITVCKGGQLPFKPRFALRFAAGFGSQVAMALYATGEGVRWMDHGSNNSSSSGNSEGGGGGGGGRANAAAGTGMDGDAAVVESSALAMGE